MKLRDGEIGKYDRTLRLAFVDVTQLVKPATSLFAPGLMLRVFRHAWGPKPRAV
jgi:hypothetical protein